MNKLLTAIAASLLLCVGTAQASSHKESPDMKADCEKQAADKKLAGAAKNSFVKKCSSGGMAEAKPSAATESCNTQAGEKKLAGAAKTSFVKKCVRDAEGGAAPAAAASAAKKK